MENAVRRWLERDDVLERVTDWLTVVYGDDVPPVRALYDRIALDRPLADADDAAAERRFLTPINPDPVTALAKYPPPGQKRRGE